MKRTILLILALTLLAAPALLADGAATYKAKCAICHGTDGTGQTAMGKKLSIRDLTTAEVQKQTDAALTAITTDGKNKMPAYKGKLTEAEIKAVVAFIRTLKK